MNKTAIEWTDFTANPLKFRDAAGHVVWGCVHASPGCQHCYAETLAKRYGKGGPFNVPTMNGLTPFLDDKELRAMRLYKPASGKRVFLADMTDLFGEWVPDALLNELFSNVLEIRTDITWQILTKRAERMHDYLSWRWGSGRIPSRHIWLGVSCEDQQRADARIPLLLQTPAAVRFISAEPLLGGIDIAKHRPRALGLHWCIVGGESGPGARPCETWWIRNLIGQCADVDVACFVKQIGSHVIAKNDDGFEGDTSRSWPMDTDTEDNINGYREEYQGAPVRVRLRDRKGGDPSEWPSDLRVRQFPEAGR